MQSGLPVAFRGGGIASLGGGVKFLVQRLQAGFDGLVAGGEADRLAGGLDCGFGVGHEGRMFGGRTAAQTPAPESRVNSGTRRPGAS